MPTATWNVRWSSFLIVSTSPLSGSFILQPTTSILSTCNPRKSYEVRCQSLLSNVSHLRIDSIIDDKTTHELYLWSFAEAVRAGTAHVMCVLSHF